MPVELSIVIVSYNVKELLRDCLNSIGQQTNEEWKLEIIVVDNASNDGSVEMVKERFPSARIISNKVNIGFSAANNEGMRISTGKFIFLLNPDTLVKQDTIRKLISFSKEQSGLFMIGPRLENSDGSLQISAWKQPGIGNVIAEAFFLHRLFGVSEYPKEKFSNIFSPAMISGAAMFFPHELFEKIGGLDVNLFWMEDADFSRRVSEAGGTITYFPTAIVTHLSGQSSRKNLKVTISNQLLSKLKYIRKYSGVLGMIVASVFCFIQILSRILLFFLLSPLSRNYREKLAAYAWTFGKFFSYLFANDKRVT